MICIRPNGALNFRNFRNPDKKKVVVLAWRLKNAPQVFKNLTSKKWSLIISLNKVTHTNTHTHILFIYSFI